MIKGHVECGARDMQLSTTHTIYNAMMTQRLTSVSGNAHAESSDRVASQTDMAKIGMMREARAIGAQAIVNMRVSVQTEPHGKKITAAGEGVKVMADTAAPTGYDKTL